MHLASVIPWTRYFTAVWVSPVVQSSDYRCPFLHTVLTLIIRTLTITSSFTCFSYCSLILPVWYPVPGSSLYIVFCISSVHVSSLSGGLALPRSSVNPLLRINSLVSDWTMGPIPLDDFSRILLRCPAHSRVRRILLVSLFHQNSYGCIAPSVHCAQLVVIIINSTAAFARHTELYEVEQYQEGVLPYHNIIIPYISRQLGSAGRPAVPPAVVDLQCAACRC